MGFLLLKIKNLPAKMPRKGECLYSPHFVMLLTVGVEHSGCGTSETVGRHECWPGIRCLIHTHAHTHSLIHTHAHAHTHSLIHTHAHAHTHSLIHKGAKTSFA